MGKKIQSKDWIVVKSSGKRKGMPSEIRIDKNGNVFLDGERYDENNSKYKEISISVENHNRMNSGEETKRMLELQNQVNRGEMVVVKDIKDPNKTETTTVKF